MGMRVRIKKENFMENVEWVITYIKKEKFMENIKLSYLNSKGIIDKL